jgi:hypothetical protein
LWMLVPGVYIASRQRPVVLAAGQVFFSPKSAGLPRGNHWCHRNVAWIPVNSDGTTECLEANQLTLTMFCCASPPSNS